MISVLDWALVPFYLLVILVVAFFVKQKYQEQLPQQYKYFFPALLAKIGGGVFFAVIYSYYYTGGDTESYFKGANDMFDLFLSDFSSFFTAFTSSSESLKINHINIARQITFASSEEEFFTVKIFFLFNLFSFKLYLPLIILVNAVAFIGFWKFFIALSKRYSEGIKLLAFGVLFIPTVLFWGSGILKDTIVMFAFLFLLYFFIKFVQKGFSVTKLVLILFFSAITFFTKSYVFIALIPCLFIASYSALMKRVKGFVKYLVAPILITIILISGYYVIFEISQSTSKYNLESIENTTKGFHSWHTSQGGSSYSLGDVDYSPTGVLSKFPAAVNVTYFRPYVWETSSAFVLFSALESLVILGLTLYIIFKMRLKFLTSTFNDPILTLFFTYSIILGFIVGFTSYNFGALARYKMPCLVTYLCLLLVLLSKNKKRQGVRTR